MTRLMKKYTLIILLLLAGLLLGSSLCCWAGTETVTGKLAYYEYDAYPYVIEVKGEKPVALYLNVDKNHRNQSVDRLLGKQLQVTGAAKVITEDTELKGLKIIDARPGNGTVKVLK
jgi:hypothetical protein